MKLPVFNPNRPYGEVYGHGLPKYYQDGRYFTGDKQPLTSTGPDTYELMDPNARAAETSVAPPRVEGGPSADVLERENAELRERLAALESKQGGGPIPVGTAPISKKPVSPAPTNGHAAPPTSDPRAKLLAMKTAQVKSIFTKAGGPEELAKGGGAQGRMIDWLIERETPAPQPPAAAPPA